MGNECQGRGRVSAQVEGGERAVLGTEGAYSRFYIVMLTKELISRVENFMK